MYSIIDIETTGGKTQDNKITEIAIINFDGKIIESTFSTLINPERNIPYFIEKLTGISNEMVSDAPKFYEIAKKIIEMTEGRIFVAHNVHFDYSFIQKEFSDLGYRFTREKLCTVRLSRLILPGHKSYSLGNICSDLNIEVTDRHRALGDASATVILFKHLLQTDSQQLQQVYIEANNKIAYPPYLDPKQYESLPNSTGVYYLWDKNGKLLYIGKSKDIKKRVASHFKISGNKAREMEFKNSIANISFKEMGNELAALLWECEEIKKHNPPFNRALNKRRYPYAIESFHDENDYIQFKCISIGQFDDHRFRVSSKKSAKSTITKIFSDCFALDSKSIHFESQLKLLKQTLPSKIWNEKVLKQLAKRDYPYSNLVISLKGRNNLESCYIIIEDNSINRIEFHNREELVETLKISENKDTRHILLQYIAKNPTKLITKDLNQI